jgi:hypothetical protein
VLFSQSFYRPPTQKKKNLDRSFSICPLKKCFFLDQNRLTFYFLWNKKFICRISAVFAEFHKLLSPLFPLPQKKTFWTAVTVLVPWKTAFFVAKTSFHIIFSVIKNSCRKKCCFRRISLVFIPPPKKNFFFWTAVSVIVSWKTAFFEAKIDFHFFFSEIKNSYAEKSAVFAEFHEFLSSPKFFCG